MITADLGVIVPIGGKQLKAYSFESLPGESFHLPVVAAALIVSDVHCTHSGKGARPKTERGIPRRRTSSGPDHRIGQILNLPWHPAATKSYPGEQSG